MPRLRNLWRTTRENLDQAHIEGALKRDVIAHPDIYSADRGSTDTAGSKRSETTPAITTQWSFVKPVMDYAYSPYLPKDMTWEDLFKLVIVESRKPV